MNCVIINERNLFVQKFRVGFMKKNGKIKLSRKILAKIILTVLFLATIIIISILAIPYIIQMQDPDMREYYKQTIGSMGVGGWFVMLGVQVLQVVVAFIPGEPVEVLSGFLFGGIGGLLLCLIGTFIGTVIIFCLVKLFGKPLVDLFVSQEKFEKLSFLHNTSRLEAIVLVLFLIPGTPKDLLTYIVPLTDINPVRFFTIATLARIPAIITSTFAGAAIYSEHFKFSLLMFSIAIVLAIIGVLLNKRITAYFKKRDKK